MATGLVVEVDSGHMVAKLKWMQDRLDLLIDYVAREAAEDLASEGRTAQPALGGQWNIDRGFMNEAKVSAPEEAWWAHFVAGGTRSHGARSAPFLLFEVDGQMVSPVQVAGVPANPFDVRALNRTRSKVDDIIRRLIG